MTHLVILTGARGVGKTTVCRRAVEGAQQRGYRCRGILTLTHEGVRHVLDVGSGHRRRLTRGSNVEGSVVQGRFLFDPGTLAWAETVLGRAVSCDLFVVDEVGPLEVERGEGWAMAFEVLRRGRYDLALLVVRPELVKAVKDELAASIPAVVTVTCKNRESLPFKLIHRLEQET